MREFAFKYQQLDLGLVFPEPIIGVGAQGKNSLALGKGKDIYISESGGELQQANELAKFENKFEHFVRFANVKQFAYDLHPAYLSTQFIYDYSRNFDNNFRTFAIGHHHAHIASCMAEHGLKGHVIGVAFDGTGFGLDENFWGGDFFLGDFKRFRRVAHFSYIPLIGGQGAIYEPWRIACAWLYEIFEDKFLNLKIDFIKRLDKKKWPYFKKMLVKRFNSPASCSVGRLFDAVSSIIGLVKSKISYEAEGPIKLEQAAREFKDSKLKRMGYNYEIKKFKDVFIIDPTLIIKGIVIDLERGIKVSMISFKFHNTFAKLILDIVTRIRRQTGLNKVVLSGGVFSNKLLSRLTREILSEAGFKVYEHRVLPPSDAGIALGQIVIARERLQ